MKNKILVVVESFIKFYYILYIVYTCKKVNDVLYYLLKNVFTWFKKQYVINKHKTQHERMNGGSYEVTTRGISS